MARYDYQPFDLTTPPELQGKRQGIYPVAIIGAGPVGLTAAIDLATRGVPSVVFDDNNVVSIGSRAICWAKRTLEIFDRLGVGERMLAKGVTWQVGRLFHGSEEIYHFDLLPEEGHKYPAFINLQQYYVEEYLVDRAREFPDLIDLRFCNKVTSHQDLGTQVRVDVETADGNYSINARYVLACDGAGSPTRHRMGLELSGEAFDENFLIADVEITQNPFPTAKPERWFWFEPKFHSGQSALLHQQPDNIYRIDLQLGPDADPELEASEDRVLPRLKAILGVAPFDLDWVSVYQFRCARLAKFVHNRVIFAGDSAHVVSPFGARGGNGGIQDVDNLCWKLAEILNHGAPEALLATYDEERGHAADENILNACRATNFMTPKTPAEKRFRDGVLSLARNHDFARRLINSGRLSSPCSLSGMQLQSNTDQAGLAVMDAPFEGGWLISQLQGDWCLLGVGVPELPQFERVRNVTIDADADMLANRRYGVGKTYLIRPDGHIAASFSGGPKEQIAKALARARGTILGQGDT